MTINYDNIPAELRSLPVWLVWKYVPREEDGKLTKVPYQVNGKHASSTDPATWTSFDRACTAYEDGGYDGLGIGISGDIAAVDIDHCVKDGKLSQMALEIVSAMDTYTEYSPSGEGLRLLFKAPGFKYDKLRYYIKNPHNGLEVYVAGCTSRYVTITGDVVMAKPIADCTEIDYVLETYMVRAGAKQKQEAPAMSTVAIPTAPAIDDWSIVDLIRKSEQAALFSSLFDRGDTSGHNGDDSAADLALCNILAFWTRKDAAQMDRLFRQSGLYREKWEREDYRRGTIDKAIRDCAKVYEPLVIHTAAQDFSEPTIPTADAGPPKLVFYDTVEYEEPEFLIKPYIPLGKLSIIQADSGVGKTALACKLAACVSRGMPMQGEPCEKGKVLILSVEDDPSTLRGRIEASGGDLTQCAFLDNAHELTFTSEIIETTIRENGIKFVVFDPLQAFLGAGMNMQLANETRPVMAHLAAMAKRTGCAVVIISHMSKGTAGSKAVYRALGSVDIVAASRSVLYVERNPDDEEQCVILHIKSSNAKAGQAILYRIGDRGGVQWEGYSALTYDDLQAHSERKEKGVDYEDEPIVIGARAYITENPKGGKLTYDEFHTLCVAQVGIAPYVDNRDAAYKIPKIKSELMQNDRILIETGAYVRRNKGISITPYAPPTMFQTGIATEATET